MEKAYIGPIQRIRLKHREGKKIIGKASGDEKGNLCSIVERALANNTSLSEEEIRANLRTKLKILYAEDIKKTRTMAFCKGNTIILNESTKDLVLKRNNTNVAIKALRIVIHECIHKIQNLSDRYEGINIRGIYEGATELIARRAAGYRPKSMSAENYKCNVPLDAYPLEVAIMAQIEVIFGKRIFEAFTLKGDTVLLKHMVSIYGWKFFKQFANNLNSLKCGIKRAQKCIEMQDELMHVYFNREYHNIKDVNSAEKFLTKLRELDHIRIHKDGDETLRIYYEETLKRLKQRFPGLDNEKYEYQEVEFYPEIYLDEQIEHLDNYALYNLSVKNPDEFVKLDLNNYKRYRIIRGENIYEIITYKGQPKFFDSYDEHCHSNRIRLDDPKRKKEIQESNLFVDMDGDDIQLSVGEPLINETLFAYLMHKISLGVTEKDIYDRMEKMYYTGNKSALPSFSKLMQKQNAWKQKQNNKKNWWELTIDKSNVGERNSNGHYNSRAEREYE